MNYEYIQRESKNKVKILMWIVIFFLEGSIMVKLVSLLPDSNSLIKILYFMIVRIHLPIILLTIIFAFFHELGHLMVMEHRKVEFRMIVSFPFILYKVDNKIKIKIECSNFFSSYIIASNKNLINKKDINEIKNSLPYILMGGVIINTIFTIIGVVIYFIINKEIGLLIIFTNLLHLISALSKNGDITKLFEINLFTDEFICFFIEDLNLNQKIDVKYEEIIINYINIKLKGYMYDENTLYVLYRYLKYCCKRKEEVPNGILKFIKWLTINIDSELASKKIKCRILIINLVDLSRENCLVKSDILEKNFKNNIYIYKSNKIERIYEKYISEM